MTVRDLIEKKDYDYIEWRITLPEKCGGGDTLFGEAKSVSSKLIPLDGDTYYEDTEVLRYEEWSNLELGVNNGLTIVFEGEWLSE